MYQTIECYYAGYKGADKAKIMTCSTADAIHYFPPGTKSAPRRGGRT